MQLKTAATNSCRKSGVENLIKIVKNVGDGLVKYMTRKCKELTDCKKHKLPTTNRPIRDTTARVQHSSCFLESKQVAKENPVLCTTKETVSGLDSYVSLVCAMR